MCTLDHTVIFLSNFVIHFMGVARFPLYCLSISFIMGKLGSLSSLTHFFLHYDIAPGSMITVLKAVRFM